MLKLMPWCQYNGNKNMYNVYRLASYIVRYNYNALKDFMMYIKS